MVFAKDKLVMKVKPINAHLIRSELKVFFWVVFIQIKSVILNAKRKGWEAALPGNAAVTFLFLPAMNQGKCRLSFQVNAAG